MAEHVGSCKVFISYKQEDTGNTFTSSLYEYLRGKGIDAFLDNESTRKAEEMLPKFLETIRSSKISIPVISTGYVKSQWCLMEQSEMVECYESKGQKILPIFFDVSATDVRDHTGIVKASLDEHKKGNDEQTIKRWKNALNVVTRMSGYRLNEVNG
ncbi:hypothetical protein NE237_031238 [Protea cynaroides]|uniref:ADP-ribosyl cyclase/cyclic ADP-ribose hydrolase n=1 Tax=Protea cynaroides TaxID=273540 RepID=A0A9Q0L1Q3_9MAGN|nr:hypothetical protein NE237_031238 [Protea cynaroides]